VKVCSQNAKKIESGIELAEELLNNYEATAIVAPSFAAAFPGNYTKLPAALRMLGFSRICQTAFGADLISKLYAQDLENIDGKTIISSSCPAVCNYIEKYFGELVPNLAKIVSPMIAMGRYLKENSKSEIKIVFIGPCVAKKSEYDDPVVSGAVDAVITFAELKMMLFEKKISISALDSSEFDPPYAMTGKSYPLAGGLIKTAKISGDILEKDVIVVEGRDKVIDIIQEISDGKIKAKLVDILFCEGCISGPAIDCDLNYYEKREIVIEYITNSANSSDKGVWKSEIFNNRTLNLRRKFSIKNQRRPMPDEEKIREILAQSNKIAKLDELNCGACGYKTCREYAVAIAKEIAEEDMCLPFMIEKLEQAYEVLKTTEQQLHSAEKLASIGQLAAGVAHELNNPLGTILIYSSMLLKKLMQQSQATQDTEDLRTIINETNRCKNIVSNLLNFARQGKLNISKVNIEQLLNKIIKNIFMNPAYNDVIVTLENESLSYHIDADEEQITQVFINLIVNACEALEKKNDKQIYIRISDDSEYIVVEIKDNGCGISQENIGRLFTPFFTTKKAGQGTGLGLAISYGIAKMHRGDITVRSREAEGTKFTVKLKKSILQD
jgi:signal transduction histidine kinase